MSDLAAGYHADIVLAANEVCRVGTNGQATVTPAYGAPAGVSTLNAETRDFGPYGVPAKIAVAAVSGTASYALQTAAASTTGLSAGSAPAAGYVAMIPGNQPVGSGSAKSLVKVPGAELYPCALTGNGTLNDAAMWANPGWMTVAAGAASGGIELPLSVYNPNFGTKVQIIAFNMKASAPAGNAAFVGQGSGYFETQGLALSLTTAGKIQPEVFCAPGFTVFGSGQSNLVYADGTEHSVMLVVHPAGYMALFRDGDLDRTWTIELSTNALGATVGTSNFTMGAAPGLNQPAVACQFRAVHLITRNEIPLNLAQIAKLLSSAPTKVLLESDFAVPLKTVLLFWGAGQSNEAGSGNTPGSTGAVGVPHRDASSRSIISGLAYKLAQRGVAALWAQTALGSTALTDAWCGRIRNWANPTNVVGGTYLLSGGKVWKCNNGGGFTGISTVAPAAGTGADSITWQDLGAATAEDTATLAATGVYPATSTRFDPLGLIAGAIAKAARGASFVTERVAIISIGQGDCYVVANAAAYADAMKKTALKLIAGGATKVLLGMTVRSVSDDAWYDAQLIPGRLAALASLAGNSRVYAGHDWATDIGPVTDQVLPINFGVRITDHVHMTDATMEIKAVPSTDAALAAAGI